MLSTKVQRGYKVLSCKKEKKIEKNWMSQSQVVTS